MAAPCTPSESLDLWPGRPPGPAVAAGPERVGTDGSATGAVSGVTRPRLAVLRPARPGGAGALVIGGGGYFRIQIGSAATPIARFLCERGITTFLLWYRLPGDGWPPAAPFQDGQRAMRLIRARAAEYGIDPARLGAVGTSAGGHLAGILATRGSYPFYPPADAIDRQDAVPDFAGLVYPVVSMRSPIDTTRTRRELGGSDAGVAAWSVETHVGPATPPIFLAHAADDPIADPRHSTWLFEAMRAAGRPAELHVFATGGHSWGLGRPGTPVAAWPVLFADWLRAQGLLGNTDRGPVAPESE